MPTRTQRVLWTALPNGPSQDGRRWRLSAMVSPRLVVSPGPADVLASFPDFLYWSTIARDARFEVELGGEVARAKVVSIPDDDVYRRLFPGATAVLSRAFEDRRGTHVLTYPVAAVERDIADVYGQLAVAADGELPTVEDMRRDFAVLGRELMARSPNELLAQIRDGSHTPASSLADRLNLVDLYNTPLSAARIDSYRRRGPADPREDVSWETYQTVSLPAPDAFQRTIDFHQIVTALAQYPALLRLAGLAIDLEVERDRLPSGPLTAPLSLRVRWSSRGATAGVTVLSDVIGRTITHLEGDQFEPASATPGNPLTVDGFLRLAENAFAVAQLDGNGSALKLRHFALSMFQLPSALPSERPLDKGAALDPVDVPHSRTGTPALRSGGLTLARDGRGIELEDRFKRSGAMEDALTAGIPVELHQEDLVRGYHIEVLDHAVGEWRSLCRRDSRYVFVADHSVLDSLDNEGILRLGASAAADGSNANVLKLHEGVFSWAGWSLSAPPIGRAIGTKDEVKDADGLAPEGLPLDVEHQVRPGSLASLRFGRTYSFRVRVADLAGNARPFDPRRSSPRQAETRPVTYLRYEPIEAPTVALVGAEPSVELPGPGEDLTTAAIHSLNATPPDSALPSPERARRHIVPPLGSQRQAELHGMLDAAGRLDSSTYSMLVARDGALPAAIHPVTGKEFPTAPAGFSLPFLPDPLALECVVRIAGRTGPGSLETLRVSWYRAGGAWPDAAAWQIEVVDVPPGGAPVAPEFNTATRMLRVPLAKADHVRVRVSHLLSDEALALLGIWRWAEERLPTDAAMRERLRDLARSGQHWMLAPWRDLELVHAVQKPLVQPAIEDLAILRPTGATRASVMFATPIDTRSTEKLDLFGRWLEPVDDAAEPGPRARIGGGARAAELKLRRLEAPGVNPPGRRAWTADRPAEHEFGDTRYRRIGYRLTATTRFTKFMPLVLQDPDRAPELTVTSAEAIGWVPNSAPPPPPDVMYVIPTFGWSRAGNTDQRQSWRDGGGLRVYLRRPWLVSGYMEMLAVVLPRAGELSADPAMAPFVTHWGSDPTWRSAAVAAPAPAADHFALAVTHGPITPERLDPMIPAREGDLPPGPFRVTGLPLPSARGALVDAVPHLVGWDPARQLWYADIVIDPGNAYAPFVKLALSRYQPVSAPGSHLSAVTTTEVMQLLPDRLAVLTRIEPLRYRVALYGHGPRGRVRPVEFAVELLARHAGTDLGWEPLPDVIVEPLSAGSPLGRTVPAAIDEPSPSRGRSTPSFARGSEALGALAGKALLAEAKALLAARRFGELIQRPDLIELLRPPLLNDAALRLPRAPQPGERFRLVITELDVRSVDKEHLRPRPTPQRDPRRRTVYVETFELESDLEDGHEHRTD